MRWVDFGQVQQKQIQSGSYCCIRRKRLTLLPVSLTTTGPLHSPVEGIPIVQKVSTIPKQVIRNQDVSPSFHRCFWIPEQVRRGNSLDPTLLLHFSIQFRFCQFQMPEVVSVQRKSVSTLPLAIRLITSVKNFNIINVFDDSHYFIGPVLSEFCNYITTQFGFNSPRLLWIGL